MLKGPFSLKLEPCPTFATLVSLICTSLTVKPTACASSFELATWRPTGSPKSTNQPLQTPAGFDIMVEQVTSSKSAQVIVLMPMGKARSSLASADLADGPRL
jgi:hypothetical protein